MSLVPVWFSAADVFFAPFLYSIWLSFMTSDDLGFITFNLALKHHLGLTLDNALPQLVTHLLDIVLIQVEFSRNLLI